MITSPLNTSAIYVGYSVAGSRRGRSPLRILLILVYIHAQSTCCGRHVSESGGRSPPAPAHTFLYSNVFASDKPFA
ncbi:unnamed protein product, partial [Brenthis ino]